jgi:hypothetical protein
LTLFSPGAPRDEYFEYVAETAARGGQEFLSSSLGRDSFFVGVEGAPPS